MEAGNAVQSKPNNALLHPLYFVFYTFVFQISTIQPSGASMRPIWIPVSVS